MIYKMKLWQKIFISSLLTSIFLFAVCGIITTVSGHKLNLQSERLAAIGLAGRMKEEVESGMGWEDIPVRLNNRAVPPGVFFQIYRDEQLVFDNFQKQPEASRYDFGYEIVRKAVEIVTIDQVNYLFAEQKLELGGKEGKLVLVKSLADVYNRCNTQLRTLFLLCSILSMVSALMMLTISLIITVPIKKINQAVKIVTGNHYAYRIPVNGSDELNELSANFNIMCEAIESNIKNYKFAIDNFTHEVKTPLTSIIGYAEILKSFQCTEEYRREAADYILSEGRRLNSLVRKIMGFLVVESKQIEKKFIKADEVISMACLSVKVQAEMKEIEIRYHRVPEVYLYGDEELLVTLLVNLLDNAIKASPDHAKIFLAAADQDSALSWIKVADFGIGIPEAELERLTEPFYMVDKSRSRSQNGIGLGLSICKAIVQAHDAELAIESQAGKGTVMTVSFPSLEYQYLKSAQRELFENTGWQGE